MTVQEARSILKGTYSDDELLKYVTTVNGLTEVFYSFVEKKLLDNEK